MRHSSTPTVSGHQNALDGLRAIAAFAVLAVHVGGRTGFAYTGSPASWVVSRGDIGVPVFFTLSGLLLYRPWARAALHGSQPPHVLSYLWRRALRILPVYWAVVLIALPTLNPAHAHSSWTWAQYLDEVLDRQLAELSTTPVKDLLESRYKKFREMGQFFDLQP